jgi:Bacterial Ig-like domain (group 3)/Carboxypeptidase regulatory-like domain
VQLAIRTSSSRRARLVLVALLGTIGAVLLFASGAAASYAELSGTVTGRIPGPEPGPLAEVRVTVFAPETEEVVASTFTNGEGNYSINLPSGTYDVGFEPPSEEFQSTTFHEVEVMEAHRLSVGLVQWNAVHLTGTLRDPEGAPIPHVGMSLYNGTHGDGGTTNAEGQFDFAVPSGRYQLYMNPVGATNTDIAGSFYFSGVGGIAAESSRDVTLKLPTAYRLTYEVVGNGAPVAGAVIEGDRFSGRRVQLGGGIEGFLESGNPTESKTTDKDGLAEYLVYGGKPETASVLVQPPKGSGFRDTYASVPTVEGDSTVAVKLVPESEGGEDTTPPSLDQFFLDRNEVDVTPGSPVVNAHAHISDAPSGVAKATVSFRSPNGEVQDAVPFILENGGTRESGEYRAAVTFEQFSEAGIWQASVTVKDNAGNEREYSAGELEELGFPSYVRVTDEKEGGEEEPDVTAPELSELSIEPDTIDTSTSGGTVRFFLHVVDDRSGFVAGRVRLTAPKGAATLEASEFRLVSGSATDGTYEFPAFFPEGSKPGEWEITAIDLSDAAENERVIEGGRLKEMGFPTTVLVLGTEPAETPIALSSSQNPSTHGQKVTLTAKVPPRIEGGPTPHGTVTFEEGTSTLGVANLTSKRTATLNTTALGAGVHDITATYSGDSNYGPGESAPLVEEVAKASTQVSLAPTLNPTAYGSSATLKATVKAVAPGAGTPAGTVTFREGGTVLATVQLSGITASLPLKSLAPGAHEITASYSGDHDDLASEAGPFTETVNAASTQLDLSSTLEPAPFGSSGTLKATVDTQAPGGGIPSGTVTFREGETILASVPLTGAVAKLALKELAPGNHSITATYNGSADYEASEGSLTETITKATTRLTVTSTKNPAPVGSTGTIKATVATVAPGGGQAAGTVTFSEGGVVLAMIPLSGTSATYPLKSLTAGTHEITATYNGSANYESSSGSISQVISP